MATKVEMAKDPNATHFWEKENISNDKYSGCKLPFTQASHCEQDFGPQVAVNGIANNRLDFFCSNFHPNGYPWILGSFCLLFSVSEVSY